MDEMVFVRVQAVDVFKLAMATAILSRRIRRAASGPKEKKPRKLRPGPLRPRGRGERNPDRAQCRTCDGTRLTSPAYAKNPQLRAYSASAGCRATVANGCTCQLFGAFASASHSSERSLAAPARGLPLADGFRFQPDATAWLSVAFLHEEDLARRQGACHPSRRFRRAVGAAGARHGRRLAGFAGAAGRAQRPAGLPGAAGDCANRH